MQPVANACQLPTAPGRLFGYPRWSLAILLVCVTPPLAAERAIVLPDGCAPTATSASAKVRLSEVSGMAGCDFEGTSELHANDPLLVASCEAILSPGSVPGSTLEISLMDTKTANLEGFRYLARSQSGQTAVDIPTSEPTPTSGPLLVKDWFDY